MSKFFTLAVVALVCVQAAPVMVSHDALDKRGREADVQIFGFLKKAAKKFLPKVVDKFLPSKIGGIAKAVLPAVTGSGPIGGRLMNAGQAVLGSGILPPKISNIANTAMNAYQGFKSGGPMGAINAVTGGNGLSGIMNSPLVKNIAGKFLGGGGGGPVGGGAVGGAQGGGSGIQAGGLGQGQGQQQQQQGGAGSAQNNHQQVLNQGQTGGVSQGPPPVATPPPPPVAPPTKPLPQVKGKSTGTGQPSKPGNPAVWKGHAVDPMLAMSGTKVSGIKGGSGDATKGFEMKGRYGQLKMQADGTWEYDLDESNALVKAYGEKPNALFDVFALEFSGMAPANKEIRIHVWEHFKKNP